MDSIDETLRKSKQVQQRLKKFLLIKKEDNTINETLKKIDKTQSILNINRQNISNINQIYNKIEFNLGQQINKAVQKVQISSSPYIPDEGFISNKITNQILGQYIKNSKNIIIISSNQLSKNYNLPNIYSLGFYRNQQKQYNLDNIIDQQILLTQQFFYLHPKQIWKWIQNYHLQKNKIYPTQQHLILNDLLQDLRRQGKNISLITQSVDGLHVDVQENSRNKNKKYQPYPIYQMNGNIQKIRCNHCSIQRGQLVYEPYQRYAFILQLPRSILFCPSCEGPLRPHLLFNDELSDEIIYKSQTVSKITNTADIIIVLGKISPGLCCDLINNSSQKNIKIVQINQICMIKKKNVFWNQSKILDVLQKLKKIVGQK